MAKNCQACIDIKDKYPVLADKGITSTHCTNLKNDEGVKAGDGKNDCDDLNLMNDCFIGNMEEEIKIADYCGWRDLMTKFANNLYNMIKAMICAICGLWTNVHNLWAEINRIWSAINALTTRVDNLETQVGDLRTRVNNLTTVVNDFADDITKLKKNDAKHDCYIDFILNGKDVSGLFTKSDFVAGTGVSFDRDDPSAAPIGLRVNGSTYTVTAGIKFSLSNSHWKKLGTKPDGTVVSGNRINTEKGNYTIAIIKMKKSKVPWLKSLSSCVGSFVNAGVGQVYVQCVDEGGTYKGQWGDSSGNVTVPSGEMHVRISLVSLTTWGIEYDDPDGYAAVSLRATGLARTDTEGIEC